MSIIISPSILSADFARLGDQLQQAEAAGADWVHIDVMDGAFVPNITMGPFIVETVRRSTSLPLDVHLMIEHPERHLEAFAKAGANWLTVHVEACPHLYATLQAIRALGCKTGVSLNPGTPAGSISAVVDVLDLVLVMSVNPGASGQRFIPSVVPKIRQVRSLLAEAASPAVIEIDGGITAQNLPEVYEAGCRAFVAASSVYKFPAGIAAGIQALRKAEPGR